MVTRNHLHKIMLRRFPIQMPVAACCLAVLLQIAPALTARSEVVPIIESRVDRDPDLSFAVPGEFFPEGLRKVWTLALKHDEADAKQLAARSIVIANQNGLTEWESTVPLLRKNLKDEHRAVRLASAAALIELQVLDAADELAEAADRDGLEMSQLVEPALGEWKIESRVDRWIEWTDRAEQNQGRAKLAMRALGRIGAAKAQDGLLKVVNEARQSSLRIVAARALGAFVASGLETHSEALSSQEGRGPRAIPRVLAAILLNSHTSDESLVLLDKLLLDNEPSVIAAAAVNLNRRDPQRLIAARTHILSKGDANVRSLLVQSLLARPSNETIAWTAELLADVSPAVRILARKGLAKISDDEKYRDLVVEQARLMLNTDGWRATEQAAHLIVHVDDKASAMRLVKLLGFPRAETYVTAAWALSETNPKQGLKETLEFAERRYAKAIQGAQNPSELGFERQLAHLFEWFGVAKYSPADELMRRCIPKSNPLIHLRRSGIWALGYLYEDKPHRAIINLLHGRLADTESSDPEDDLIRLQCTIAIGRMRDKESVAKLRERAELEPPPASPIADACSWALNRITGEPLPTYDAVPGYRSGFFLESISD